MTDTGASDHYFDDAIIATLSTVCKTTRISLRPARFSLPTMLDVTAVGVLQGLVTDDCGNQILIRVDIVMVPGVGRNMFSMTSEKRAL